jgi:hypothetical protein
LEAGLPPQQPEDALVSVLRAVEIVVFFKGRIVSIFLFLSELIGYTIKDGFLRK